MVILAFYAASMDMFLVSMVTLPTSWIASRALTQRLARIWSNWDGSILTGHSSGAGRQVQVDVLTDEPPQHLEQIFDGLVQIEHFRGDGLFAGEGQQLAGNVPGALGRIDDFAEIAVQSCARAQVVHGQLGVADDHAQDVVEVVGHPTGQTAHRF